MKVHSVESLAALDGEGIRYDIFLSGCPLRCVYCHNPDTWNGQAATEKTAEELFAKIKRYVPYFKASGGGVTFSGGEPLLQAEKIVKLGDLLKTENIGYTLDTSGCVDLSDSVKKAVEKAELVICDLKFPDCETFKRYTGGDFNTVIKFFDYLKSISKRTWVRTVIVPNINDSEEMLDRYIKVLSNYKSIIEKYELLGFHTMGFFKYQELGVKNPLADYSDLSKEKLKELQEYADLKMK
jgi:pyruvate formate lyase activating enzyme